MPATPAAPPPVPHRSGRSSKAWWGIPALSITLLTGALLSWHSLGDLDIWFHLRAGRDLLAGRGVISENQYSFTEPDHPWVNHEWMFQALAALTGPSETDAQTGSPVPEVAGWAMTRMVLVLMVLATILAGDGGLNRLRGKDGPTAAAWSGIPLLAGLLLLWPRLTIRPELISYLFFVLLIRGVEQVFSRLRVPGPGAGAPLPAKTFRWTHGLDPRQPAGRLFLLTVVWAQFHGFAALVPLVVLLGWILAPIQSRLGTFTSPPTDGAPGWRAPLVLGLGLVALALTPNGPGGLLMPLRALGQFSQSQVDLRTTISELVPLQDSPNSLGLTIAAYRMSLAWSLIWIIATLGRVSLVRIAVFALAAFAAWSNQRSIGFYAVAFILLHTGAGSDPWRFPAIGRRLSRRPGLTAAVGLVLTLTAGALWWPRIVSDDFYLKEGVSRRFGTGLTPAQFQVEAAATLARRPRPAVFANIDAAGFLLGNTTARPFIDGRTEAYSADLWAEYLTVKKGGDPALAILARRSVDSVLLATGSGAFLTLAGSLLASESWQLAHAEGAGLLFQPGQRPDSPVDLLEEAARKTLAGAAGKSPARSADLCLAAGRLLEFAGNAQAREAAFRRGLTFKDNHPALHHNLGNVLLGRNEFREALSHFTAAAAMNPRLTGSFLNAGVCQMRLGDPTAAAHQFRRAADLDPGRFEAWANLSSAYLASGNREGAVAALEKARELRPGDQQLRNRLREIGGK